MPRTIFRGDYEQLAQIAQRFASAYDAVQRAIDRVRQQMNVLQAGDWVGDGATAFYTEMNSEVLPSLRRLANALRSAQQIVAQISREIKQAEDEATMILRHDELVNTGSRKALYKPDMPQTAIAGETDQGNPPPSVPPAGTSGPAHTQKWWKEMLQDPRWNKALMDAATRHNPPGSGLTDRSLAAIMASIILIESGALAGRAQPGTFKAKFGAWVNRQSDEVRVPIIMSTKIVEIFAYQMVGASGNSLGLMNFNMARLAEIQSDPRIKLYQYTDDANAFCPFPGENVCVTIPKEHVPDFLANMNRDVNQLVRQDQYIEYMAASFEKLMLDAKPYVSSASWTAGGATLPMSAKMFAEFQFAGIAEGVPLIDPITGKPAIGGWATLQELADAKTKPDPLNPTWGDDTEKTQKDARAYADAVASYFWAAIAELDAAGYK